MIPYCRIAWFFPLLLLSGPLVAQESIVVSSDDKELRVSFDQMLTFEDTTGDLTFAEIRTAFYQSGFRTNDFRVEDYASAYWTTFTFTGKSLQEQSWFLEGRDPNTHQMDFYLPNEDGSYSSHEMGLLRPFEARPMFHKNFVLELPNHSDSITVFVRIASHNPAQFLFRLKSAEFLLGYSINEYLLLGIFYGIILIMAVYNFLLYFFMQDKLYIWYVIYVISGALTCLIEDGLGFQYLWPGFFELNHYMESIVGIWFLVSFLFYANSFIEISGRRPQLFKVLCLITAGAVLYLVFHRLFGIQTSLISIYSLPYTFVFGIALSLLQEGYKPARPFVLATSMVMISLLILFLNKVNLFGWIEMNNLTIILLVYAFNIALVFEAIILSFGQARKLRHFQEQQQGILEASESRFRGIFQASSDAILVYDFQSEQILNFNQKALHLFGYSGAMLQSCRLDQLIQLPSMSGGSSFRDIVGQHAHEAQFFEQANGIKMSGDRFDCEFTIAPLQEIDEKYSVVAIKDTSRQKTAERSLEKRIGEIRDKNRQLEKYIASNLELENFAYVASHDIRQPLRTMNSFSQLIQRKLKGIPNVPESVQEYLQFIIAGATDLEAMITGLLEHSRINQIGEYQFATVAMHDLLEQVRLNLNEQIRESGATLSGENLPQVFADPTSMVQLLQNLISNAIKFRKKDIPCQIHVHARPQDDHWLFSVSDNGIGIAPEKQESVFQLFTQLHAKSKYEGYGIGLATCKKIVEIHHGEIWLESELGVGTTFYFTLSKEYQNERDLSPSYRKSSVE